MYARLTSASFPVMIASALASVGGAAPCHAQERVVRQEEDEDEEGEEIVVQATRSGRLVQDEPIRVEVINREEIEEKILMVPGNIAMIVNETWDPLESTCRHASLSIL